MGACDLLPLLLLSAPKRPTYSCLYIYKLLHTQLLHGARFRRLSTFSTRVRSSPGDSSRGGVKLKPDALPSMHADRSRLHHWHHKITID